MKVIDHIQRLKLPLSTATLAVFVACGGGSEGSGSQTLSGKVIDGYIEGATVCLDVNANLQCDAGEPTAVSTAPEGNYTLPPYAGSIDGLQIIAVVPPGAKDSDLGTIEKAFDLVAPAESADVITPLTTLVATEMSSRKISASEAEQAIKAQFNLQADSLLGFDFKMAGDNETLKVAQVVAASMATVKENLGLLNQRSDLGLSKADIFNAALSEVKTSVLPQVLSSDGTVMIDIAGKSQAQLVAAVASKAGVAVEISGRIQQIVAQTKSGNGSVLDMAEAFKNAFMIGYIDSGRYIHSTGPVNYRYEFNVEYIQYDSAKDSRPFFIEHVWMNGLNGLKWYERENYDDEVQYTFDGSAWIKSVGDDIYRKPIFSGNCLVLPLADGATDGTKLCGVAKDLSGKNIADFFKGTSGVFPNGSLAYDLTLSTSIDLYSVWTGTPNWSGYGYMGKDWSKPEASTPTIEKFVEHLQTQVESIGWDCQIGMKIKTLPANGKKGTIEWGKGKQSSSGCSVDQFTETTTFVVEKVGDRDVLRTFYPNLYRELNPSETGANELIFTVVDKDLIRDSQTVKIKGIYRGDYSPAARSTSWVFNGNFGANPQVGNKVLYEAILKAKGTDPYPYTATRTQRK